jgi:hypothetical protein
MNKKQTQTKEKIMKNTLAILTLLVGASFLVSAEANAKEKATCSSCISACTRNPTAKSCYWDCPSILIKCGQKCSKCATQCPASTTALANPLTLATCVSCLGKNCPK